MFSDSKKFKWKKVDFDDAVEKYPIDHFSYDGVDALFSDEPEHYLVHKGDVTIDGLATFGAGDSDEVTMHVIQGNLTVKGPFVFTQDDYHAGLYVTGTLTCESNAFVASDAQLFVGKSMHVKGLLATCLTDAGHFAVKDTLVADSWLEVGDNGGFEIGKKPKARLLRCSEDTYSAFSEADDDGEEDEDDEKEEDDDRDDDDDDSDAEDDDGDQVDAKDEDSDDEERTERFGFSPREAVSIKGILQPELLEGDEDVDIDKLEDAIREGQPLFI